MSDSPLTRAEATVLIDERIKQHEEDVGQPKHQANTNRLDTLTVKVDAILLSQAASEATQKIVMKFAGAGVIVWSLRQLVEIVQSFHK